MYFSIFMPFIYKNNQFTIKTFVIEKLSFFPKILDFDPYFSFKPGNMKDNKLKQIGLTMLSNNV